jgi:hypothetical protein
VSVALTLGAIAMLVAASRHSVGWPSTLFHPPNSGTRLAGVRFIRDTPTEATAIFEVTP